MPLTSHIKEHAILGGGSFSITSSFRRKPESIQFTLDASWSLSRWKRDWLTDAFLV
jgi:hypothetical protein